MYDNVAPTEWLRCGAVYLEPMRIERSLNERACFFCSFISLRQNNYIIAMHDMAKPRPKLACVLGKILHFLFCIIFDEHTHIPASQLQQQN
jgi:hypothetical protein